ncbi:MAG: hypothetical protein IJX76_03570 [Clostridia bacterium]|nr:hypothetical protein [Clostridia bacterium]
MKKFTTILIILCMLLSLLPMAVHAEAAPTNLLAADKLVHHITADAGQTCDGTFNADGTMTAANKDANDAAFLTDLVINKGEHVYIEVTAKITDGLAWGIFLSESGKDNAFDKWFCLNVDTDRCNTRLFLVNTKTQSGIDYFLGTDNPTWSHIYFPNARDGEYHTLGLEILADGTMKLYLDGEMHTYLDKASFEGATLGLMTCRADVQFKSFSIREGAPTRTTVRNTAPRTLEYSSTTNLLSSDVLKYTSGNGGFTIADGKMTAARSGGDRAILSDIFVKPGDHVYIEATGKITDGNAWGIMLAETDKTNPFGSGWVCINASVDVFKTRIFCVNAACNVNQPIDPYWFDPSIARGEDLTLGLEITPDGTFYLTCNGVCFAENKATVWNGGYVGLMTWEAGVEFTSATYNVVSGVALPETATVNTANELLAYIAQANAATASNPNATVGKTLIIGSDIDLAGKTWTPLTSWIGTLDGNGKTLSGISYTTDATGDAGLIALKVANGDNQKGTVKNLTLKNCSITATSAEKVGAIAGMTDRGRIIDCTVDSCTIAGGKHVGGVVGRISYAYENIDGVDYHYCTGNTVKNSTVSGTEKVGALVGRIRSDGVTYVITDTTVSGNTVTVSNGGKKGEVFGSAEAGTVVDDKGVGKYADDGTQESYTCYHNHTEKQNAKKATTEEPGYTGDTVCKDCGVTVETGKEIPKLEKPAQTGDATIVLTVVAAVALAGAVIVSKRRERA